ncbi:uncharacterized protein PITG_16064 [Phytophthora infestans T30-4]|uniref:Uncharacterized protein n=2 Tax=Phytophthora infestans TaxID=4787 RepID=D0NSS7_PHYIT|nr:uncharacterized protein PITG_16064 [Phytophthora infestans T30-4]EEY64639.1 hypothetical protein PITG_16064 [Phytophthora infestans T30-4]|eukprot:XP_002897839.1 hypothetical protein PITG_16064 [Phytophthora infestans T30-4]
MEVAREAASAPRSLRRPAAAEASSAGHTDKSGSLNRTIQMLEQVDVDQPQQARPGMRLRSKSVKRNSALGITACD